MAGHIRAGWLDESWRIYTEHTDLGDNFNPEVGFVPRVGIKRSKFHFEGNPRPERWGIRMMEPMWNVEHIADQSGRLMTRRYHHMVGTRFDNGSIPQPPLRPLVRTARRSLPGGERCHDRRGELQVLDAGRQLQQQPVQAVLLRVQLLPANLLRRGSLRLVRERGPPGNEPARDLRALLAKRRGSPRRLHSSPTSGHSSSTTRSPRTCRSGVSRSTTPRQSSGARAHASATSTGPAAISTSSTTRSAATTRFGVSPWVDEFRDRQLIIKMTYLLSM